MIRLIRMLAKAQANVLITIKGLIGNDVLSLRATLTIIPALKLAKCTMPYNGKRKTTSYYS